MGFIFCFELLLFQYLSSQYLCGDDRGNILSFEGRSIQTEFTAAKPKRLDIDSKQYQRAHTYPCNEGTRLFWQFFPKICLQHNFSKNIPEFCRHSSICISHSLCYEVLSSWIILPWDFMYWLIKIETINNIILVIFCLDTIMKLQLKWDYFFLDNSKVELAGFIFFVLNGIINLFMKLNHDIKLVFQFLVALFILLRCKKCNSSI